MISSKQLINFNYIGSSSGRLSTGSHCSGTSLGDSGTHSDAESDRKPRSTNSSCCNTFKTKDGLDNYDIPPSPICLLSTKPKQSNGILNYDIPPPLSKQNGLKHHWDNESCPSCDSLSNDVNYYNLISKDIPIPNQSTLHNRLASSKNCLQIVEEDTETKTEDNCYEYINLPGLNGKVTAKCIVIGSDDEDETVKDTSIPDINMPDYVNVENDGK